MQLLRAVALLVLFAVASRAEICRNYAAGDAVWSTAITAGSGGNVTISSLVWLDTASSVVYNNIEITSTGKLHFKPGQALSLRAKQIYIRPGGEMVAGCSAKPFTDNVEIVMYGKRSDWPNGLPDTPGVKVINVNGGTLQIFAAAPTTTWTLLTATAEYDIYAPAGTGGANTIQVLDPVRDWPVGGKILVASSDYNADLSEVRTISAISADGKTITLDTSLDYQHYGKVWTWPGTGDSVDERAEVALLSRSFKFYGDTTDGESGQPWEGFGGQIFVNAGSLVQVTGVELFQVGQRGTLARYPIHFHMCADMTDSFVNKNVFHDTFQRCLTVHGTNRLHITDNVAYNSTGHCYFIEDGTEQWNSYVHNLGVVAKPPCCRNSNGDYVVGGSQSTADTRLLATDEEPAIFWITHPNNDFVNNSAVGGSFGYWYSLPRYPIGVSYTDPLTTKQLIFPQLSIAGLFVGNKAHSCGNDGLFVDRGITENPPCATGTKEECGDAPDNTSYNPRIGSLTVDSGTSMTSAQIQSYLQNQPYAYSIFEEFTGHHCRDVAMWGRGSGIVVIRAHLADSQIGAQFPGDGHILLDSIFVAETDNVGNPGRDGVADARSVEGRTRPVTYNPAQPIIGYRTYDAGGPTFVYDSRFYNFQMFFFEFGFRIRYAGAFSGQGGPNCIQPRMKFYNNSFYNTSDLCRVYVYPGHDNAFHGWATADYDGTLTGGLKDYKGGCGSWVVGNNNSVMLTPGDSCQWVWGWNAHLCPGDGVSAARRAHRIGNYDDNNVLPIVNDWGPGVSMLGVWQRLADGANSTMEPDQVSSLPSSGEYPSGGNTVRLTYPNTLLVNEEYLFQFGLGSTPSKFAVNMVGMTGGNAAQGTLNTPEWIRFAFAFPTGTTYTIWGEGGSACTKVDSRGELKYNTYFVEASATAGVDLLFIHMEPDSQSWSYYSYGMNTWGGSLNFQINASCPNSVCNVNFPVALPAATPVLPAKPLSRVCENGGRSPAGGALSYTLSGSSSDIFTNTLGTGWSIPSWVNPYNYTDNMSNPPTFITNNAIVATWQSYNSIRFQINGGIPINTFTHLRFDVRSGDGLGPLNMVARFDSADGNIGRDVAANTPWGINNGIVPDDSKWTTVYISLADALIGDPALSAVKITAITIYNAQGRNTTVYMDNVSLGKYTSNIVAAPAPNPTSASTVTGDFGTGSGPAGKPLNGFVPPTGSAPIQGTGSSSGSAVALVVSFAAMLFAALMLAM